ncbi:Zinc finger protein ZPR1 like protein [Nosema granulosis]|uniref:Zinc finger protein ZPR1 like protein n=1 Tax=Nosema granulosis TaxID=83296 RepID=A0A9P6GZU5_9MICR|nr:Zinc finger protein ZPR1 like protein [Nosema granulosis]
MSYNDELQDNLLETDSKCLSCGLNASLRYLKLDQDVVLTVFECTTCNIKETSMFNSKETTENALLIDCKFCSTEDLKRQINLNKNTGLSIKYEDLEYTFESSESNVYTVEAIIHQAIKQLSGEGDGFSTIQDSEKLNKSIAQLRAILINPHFELSIVDSVGVSRVAPIGEDIYKIQDRDLDFFNDERVHHRYLHKRNEEI